jgi:hypothetical protein
VGYLEHLHRRDVGQGGGEEIARLEVPPDSFDVEA